MWSLSLSLQPTLQSPEPGEISCAEGKRWPHQGENTLLFFLFSFSCGSFWYLSVCLSQRVLEEAGSKLSEVTRDSAHYQQMLRDLIAQVTNTPSSLPPSFLYFVFFFPSFKKISFSLSLLGSVSTDGGRGDCSLSSRGCPSCKSKFHFQFDIF